MNTSAIDPWHVCGQSPCQVQRPTHHDHERDHFAKGAKFIHCSVANFDSAAIHLTTATRASTFATRVTGTTCSPQFLAP